MTLDGPDAPILYAQWITRRSLQPARQTAKPTLPADAVGGDGGKTQNMKTGTENAARWNKEDLRAALATIAKLEAEGRHYCAASQRKIILVAVLLGQVA